MHRALTKPRLVTREMTEEDMEFYENDRGAPCSPPGDGNAAMLIIFAAVMVAGFMVGWALADLVLRWV